MVVVEISDELRFAVRLVDAIKNYDPLRSDLKSLRVLIEMGGDKEYQWYQDDQEQTPLHHAASLGYLQICELLREAGHPWNCLDIHGKTPAECAQSNGHDSVYEYLLQEGIRSEMILNAISGENEDELKYLGQNVRYDDGLLIDSAGDAVMMKWEAPLMLKHAKVICGVSESAEVGMTTDSCTQLVDRSELPAVPLVSSESELEPFRVLNVGFGMGIIDTYIHQLLECRARQEPNRRFIHYIIEAHPGVRARMKTRNWTSTETTAQPELVVLEGKWQDVMENIYEKQLQFDGIFFDTFGEDYSALQEFHEHVGNILRSEEGSVYSFFNGLGGRNPFFNHVYSNIVELELQDMGLVTTWETVDVDIPEGDWVEDIKHKYFLLNSYRFPIVKFEMF